MNVITLQMEEMLRLVEARHNPPAIQNEKDENLFQAEIRALYDQLV